MKDRFCKLTKYMTITLCLAVSCVGLYSCSDNYDLDDEGNYPSWLGSSIYDELASPNQELLTGTFTNYLKLIDDLGYKETLQKTGSKTVFAANDEAFERFFKSNSWGVTSYGQLTTAMKKQLLYSSMLDNALLLEMLSNVNSSDETVTKGIALKHTTSVNLIDTITHLYGPADYPVNNSQWDDYKGATGGISLIMDATKPMMVHFTNEEMIAHNITTSGTGSDFSILTGSDYSDGLTYIFRNKVIKGDVTCKNGYIQQLENVLIPPGNIAEVIRTNGETNLFSRMLDRFSAPYYDDYAKTVTNNYNDWATANNKETIDKIYEKRYFSSRSHGNNSTDYSMGSEVTLYPNKTKIPEDYLLPYDPGWNEYTNGSTLSNSLSDLAAMFVPSDSALENYFLPGRGDGSGVFLIERYGKLSNTKENLKQNIDSIPLNIVQAFLSNLMKSSFTASVPSKFNDIMDDASDPMGITTNDIHKNGSSYDIKIANNGVMYVMNKVFAPAKYVAVSAPALFSDSMRVINWAIQNNDNSNPVLHMNFYAYLLAMTANYGLLLPTDEAFKKYYIDPASLNQTQPRALKFTYDKKKGNLLCSSWEYDKSTGTVRDDKDSLASVSISSVTTQLIDILNYNTIVLGSGETLGSKAYYKTKHGGEIKVDNKAAEGTYIESGGQIDNGLEKSKIEKIYPQKNGTSYRIDHLIVPPMQSVYKVLSEDPRYTEFMALADNTDAGEIMTDAGISSKTNTFGISEQDKYLTFGAPKSTSTTTKLTCLDNNVNYFNTYNYTVYAPDNDAMAKAFKKGLPKWSDVRAFLDVPGNATNADSIAKAKKMINAINLFIRYHFQDNSIYADKVIETGKFPTSCVDSLGIYQKLTVDGSDGTFKVYDNSYNSNGTSHYAEISESTSSKMVNQMTRDYVFVMSGGSNTIRTSSFAVVHEIDDPLAYNASGRYDDEWNVSSAKKSAYLRAKYHKAIRKR